LSRKATTIWVKFETWVALKNLGKKGDTFDDIIRRLLEKAKE